MKWRSCGGATATTILLLGCFGEAPSADCVDAVCDETQTTTQAAPSSSDSGVGSATEDSESWTGTATGGGSATHGSDSGGSSVDSSTTGTPAECGNGVIEAGEDCDDANDAPYDGCRACGVTLELVEQFVLDVSGRADSVLTLARDGAAVIAGGRTSTTTEGLDAVWLRASGTMLQPPAWYQTASLPFDNVVEAVARGPGVCAVGGFITLADAMVPAANLVACDDGSVGTAFSILPAQPVGSGAVHAMVVDGTGTIFVGGEWTSLGTTRGFVQEFTAEGMPGTVTWFDDVDAFGSLSRVRALTLDEGGALYVGGSWSDGGAPRGFFGRIDLATSEPVAFAGPAAGSEVEALVVRAGAMWAAGWADAATRDAVVELQDDAATGATAPLAQWSLGLPSDSRANGLAPYAAGVVAVGVTATATGGDDLVVAVLGDDATELGRAVFDGPGTGDDAANAVVTDGTAIHVGGHVTIADQPDLLVQHWQLPTP